MAPAPIQFDRASGALEGGNLRERTAAVALTTGSKISSHFSHRGYNHCANLLRKALPKRNVAIKLNPDATLDPRSNRMETVTDLSILDRTKVSSNTGYNVFGTASAFWQGRINGLNVNAARHTQ
jgi:hypothetical protein